MLFYTRIFYVFVAKYFNVTETTIPQLSVPKQLNGMHSPHCDNPFTAQQYSFLSVACEAIKKSAAGFIFKAN